MYVYIYTHTHVYMYVCRMYILTKIYNINQIGIFLCLCVSVCVSMCVCVNHISQCLDVCSINIHA
jgi:hypothetical protein